MEDKIIKMHTFQHAISEVWEAISDGEKLCTWFAPADFKAEVGHKYTIERPQRTITGEVLHANPVDELVYTWIEQGTDVVTTVSWQLEETGNGTIVTLEHSGISKYPDAAAMYLNFKDGWDKCMAGLEEYLATHHP